VELVFSIPASKCARHVDALAGAFPFNQRGHRRLALGALVLVAKVVVLGRRAAQHGRAVREDAVKLAMFNADAGDVGGRDDGGSGRGNLLFDGEGQAGWAIVMRRGHDIVVGGVGGLYGSGLGPGVRLLSRDRRHGDGTGLRRGYRHRDGEGDGPFPVPLLVSVSVSVSISISVPVSVPVPVPTVERRLRFALLVAHLLQRVGGVVGGARDGQGTAATVRAARRGRGGGGGGEGGCWRGGTRFGAQGMDGLATARIGHMAVQP
jgi:hypothetical protein